MTFDLLVGKPQFSINGATGVISTAAPLNYETKASYTITVIGQAAPNEVIAEVTITVLDSPEVGYIANCMPSFIHIQLAENSPPLNTSKQVICSTELNNTDLELVYGLVAEENPLLIDSLGFISLGADLDYEDQALYKILLTLSDSDSNPFSINTVTILLEVLPVNEFPPVFFESTLNITVSESVAIATSVGTVYTTDEDLGMDGDVLYTLLGYGSDDFVIDSSTGIIYYVANFDFETVSHYEITITAYDNPSEASSMLFANATLNIHVEDVNDNPPLFTSTVYSSQLPEESTSLTTVLHVKCTDADSGTNSEIEYSSDGSTPFLVDPDSGAVTIGGAVNYEEQKLYKFNVFCSDKGTPSMPSDLALVIIQLTSANEFAPVFKLYSPNFSVLENVSIGTKICQMEAVDQDDGPAGHLVYQLQHTAVCPEDMLQIESSTGTVYLVDGLDYESSTFLMKTLFCNVFASDGQNAVKTGESDFTLTIGNINDVVPVCDPNVLVTSVQEDISIPSTLLSLPCSDEDSPSLTYSIINGSSTLFQIQNTPTGDVLVLQNQLDYESAFTHHLHVAVSDDDFSTTLDIHVSVAPVNEYTPVFTTSEYVCNVSESSMPGSVICSLSASDEDSGMDGKLVYKINGETQDKFYLNFSSGELLLMVPLDYEQVQVFELTVETHDFSLTKELSAFASIVIHVMDENDNAPTMIPHQFVSVEENPPFGTGISSLVCNDLDTNDNGKVSVNVTSALVIYHNGSMEVVPNSPFSVSSSGMLQASGDIDYETTMMYQLEVTCTDHGVPPLATTSTITVIVLPVNEFYPEFTLPDLILILKASETVGTTLFISQTEDQDLGDSGIVQYFLASEDGSSLPEGLQFLAVDPNAGELTLVLPVTCAYGKKLPFLINATDLGSPPLTSSMKLTINIEDCELEPPVSSSSVYTAATSESTGVGSPVLQVSCFSPTPLALPVDSLIQYAFEEGSEIFNIDVNSGVLSTADNLDFEAQNIYTLHIQCYYSHNHEFSTEMTVYIQVLPENEHTPVFGPVEHVTLSEDHPTGGTVTILMATDLDTGVDGYLRYEISTPGPFVIDYLTGTVYLIHQLDREKTANYSIEVIAFDSPMNISLTRSAMVTLTIAVSDINDNSPQCSSKFYYASILPTMKVGSLILPLNCTDPDDLENATLNFTQQSSKDRLLVKVDHTGGVVLAHAITADTLIHHTIPVEVWDNGSPPLSVVVYMVLEIDLSLEYVVASTTEEKRKEALNNNVTFMLENFPTALVSIHTRE